MAEHAVSMSTQPSHRVAFAEVSWGELHEPGAYADRDTGDFYRVPLEAIGPVSPLITKQSLGGSRLLRLSGNPFVTTLEARMLCAECNVTPNF